MLPNQKEIEIPLLEVLVALGGESKAKDIYPLVKNKFPLISPEDLKKTYRKGQPVWSNTIQWARSSLVSQGEIDNSTYGVWRITEKGRARLRNPELPFKPKIPKAKKIREKIATEILPQNLLLLHKECERSFRQELLKKLLDLSPKGFEEFAKHLLGVYGFIDMMTTRISRDGGIDGHGKLKVGIAYMNVAYQCKKWQGKIGRPEIDKFRGACQGKYEQGIFFTTSDFSPDALEASFQTGAVPIILIPGEAIIDLMIEKGLGVERIPLYRYEMKPDDFVEIK